MADNESFKNMSFKEVEKRLLQGISPDRCNMCYGFVNANYLETLKQLLESEVKE